MFALLTAFSLLVLLLLPPSTTSQQICHDPAINFTNPIISWCGRVNPFSTITHTFSDVDFSDEFFVKFCSEDEPITRAICMNTATIRSLEWTLESVDEHNSDAPPTLTDARLVAFNLKNEAVVVVNFNSPSNYTVLNQPSAHPKKEKLMTAFSWNGQGLVVTSDARALAMFSVRLNSFEYVGELEIPQGYTLSRAIFLQARHLLFGLVHFVEDATQDHKMFVYYFQPEDLNTILLSGWTIRNVQGSLQWDINTQHGNFNETNTSDLFAEESSLSQRTIITMQDDYRVVSFQLTDELLLIPHVEIDMKNIPLATIVDVENEGWKIIDASFIYDTLRNMDWEQSSCESVKDVHPSQSVFIVLTMANEQEKKHQIFFKHLPEFERIVDKPVCDYCEYKWNNPLNRTVICNSYHEYWNGEQCVTSREQALSFNGEQSYSSIEARFVSTPTTKSTHGARVISASELCNVYMSILNVPISICESFANLKEKCVVDSLKSSDQLRGLVFKPFLYSVVFVPDGSMVRVIDFFTSTHPDILPQSEVFAIAESNKLFFAGNIHDIHVSRNSFHLFVSISRKQWEFDSAVRYLEMCSILLNETLREQLSEEEQEIHNAPMMRELRKQCEIDPARRPDLNFFSQSATSCPPGLYCESLRDSVVRAPTEGHYTLRTNEEIICPRGSFCTKGIRLDCPIGTKCSREGLTMPERCSPLPGYGFSCHGTGMVEQRRCKDGAICVSPAFPDLPAPPGYFVEELDNDVRELHQCEPGEFCPLGRHVVSAVEAERRLKMGMDNGMYSHESTNQKNAPTHKINQLRSSSTAHADRSSLACPPYTYCPNSTVLFPKPCVPELPSESNDFRGKTRYCPQGTSDPLLCPAGFSCKDPKNMTECSMGFYCPEGTILELPCPKGKFCETPSEAEPCPLRHRCPEGSITPQVCSFLAQCYFEKGMDSNGHWLYGLAIMLPTFILGALLLANCVGWCKFSYLAWCTRKRRKKSAAKSYKRELGADESTLQQTERVVFDIEFQNLDLKLGKLQFLHHVGGVLEGGALTVVMGASGCGKSSLLTSLVGLHPAKLTGDILVNGVPFHDLSSFGPLIGNVPQTDVMDRRCTVKDTIEFSLFTRVKPNALGITLNNDPLMQRIENMLDLMDMKHVQNTIIGDENRRGVSGGQLKKVSTCMEMVTSPRILILDEPTSGLDGATSFSVVEALRRISREEGVTTAAVIHQPREELFYMCDNLLLLRKGGYVCYSGRTRDVVQYFKSIGIVMSRTYNAADFCIDLVSGDVTKYPIDFDVHPVEVDYLERTPRSPEEISHAWDLYCEASERHFYVPTEGLHIEDASSPALPLFLVRSNQRATENRSTQKSKLSRVLNREKSRRPANCLVQLWCCLIRDIRILLVEIYAFLTSIGLLVIGAIFLGFVFFKMEYQGSVPEDIWSTCPGQLKDFCKLPRNNPLIVQAGLTGLTVSLIGLMSGLGSFYKPNAVYMREAMSGLGALPVYVSRSVVDLILQVTAALVFTVVYYIAVAPRTSFILFLMCVFSIFSTAFSLGYLLGTIIPTKNSKLAGVVYLMIAQLFSGMVPRLSEFEKAGILWQAMTYTSYLRFSTEVLFLLELRQYSGRSDFQDVQVSLDMYSYHWGDLWWCCIAVVAFQIVFRISAFVCLWLQTPQSAPNVLLGKHVYRARPVVFVREGLKKLIQVMTSGQLFIILSCYCLRPLQRVMKSEDDLSEVSGGVGLQGKSGDANQYNSLKEQLLVEHGEDGMDAMDDHEEDAMQLFGGNGSGTGVDEVEMDEI